MTCDKLYVITAIFNPWRYNSRSKLYYDFKKHIEDSGAELVTIECSFGNRGYEVTTCQDLQVKTNSELWHKERLLNLAIQSLPHDWKYVAWIDADLLFVKPNWVNETIHLLQHYSVIQMFSHAVDVGPNHEHLKTHTGILYAYRNSLMSQSSKYDNLHPGFAWAARREALNDLGLLFDTAVLGSADRHMALCLIEKYAASCPRTLSIGYMKELEIWQERCKKHIKKNVGYLPGTIIHNWHGKKVDRRYQDRWKILVKYQFDPEVDLKSDVYGLWQFSGNKPDMEQEIRNYFQCRNEDSIDVV